MVITSIYASMLGLLFINLSIGTIKLRRKYQVAIGDGGNQMLQRAIRAHANFAEYVPISLLLIYFVELANYPNYVVHLLGLFLVIGRISHAFGIKKVDETYKFRIFGMMATFCVIAFCAILILANLFIN